MTTEGRAARMSSLGKVGGLVTVARHGPDAIAARARRGLWQRFVDDADPKGELPEAERFRRARLVQRAYYQRLSLLSATARRRAADDS